MQKRRWGVERRYWMRCAAFFTVPQNGLTRTFRGYSAAAFGLTEM
jgi:hypothetical protein